MSHVIKIILRVILARIRRCTRDEIGKEQFGFRENSGTTNAIFTLKMLCERSIEMQQDLYLCFIDYTKAFDKVQHEKLIEILQSLDMDGKDIRLITNLYWEQTAAVRAAGIVSEYVKVERGVRQGCVISPELFNVYSERVMQELQEGKGCVVGGHNINNLRYADDAVLISNSVENLQALLDKVVTASNDKGLSINIKKTECMVITKKRQTPSCNINIEQERIKQVAEFKYLGTIITEDGRCEREIKTRIGMAKEAFSRLKGLVTNTKMSLSTRKRLVHVFVLPILLYGCECWTLTSQLKKKLEAMEMWLYRRMLKISWTEHVTNEEVLKRAQTERNLLASIIKRQLKFLGHVLRKDSLENLVLTGKIEGKRDRGRQRMTFMKTLSTQTNIDVGEMLHLARDRRLWRIMVADVLKGYGT